MLFSCFNAVNASDVNETLIGDSGDVLTLESIDGEMLGANAASFNELANEIKNVGNGGTLSLNTDYEYSSGNSAIVIDKKITINGNGFKIDAKKSSNIFNCYGDEKVFNNIVFCNGYSKSNGGAIYSESKLTFNDCVFEGNWISDDSLGVAIFSTSDVALERCTFKNHNSPFFYEELYLINSKSISIRDSMFLDNDCGVSSFETNVNAFNSQFSNNMGKCLYSEYFSIKDCHIKNCTFIGNDVTDMGSQSASAILIVSPFAMSSIEIDACKFINNTCRGTTVLLFQFNGVLNDCEFIGNSGLDGGGLYIYNSNVTVMNSKFDSNVANASGGAIYTFQSEMDVYSTDFINNFAKNGGAVYWDCHNSMVLSCNFISNVAENGGAIYNFNLLNNNIEKSYFSHNDADNAKYIFFNTHFLSYGDSQHHISKFSENRFDSYDSIYGGAFSFEDNILNVVNGNMNVFLYIDGQIFDRYFNQKELSIDLSNLSSGIHDARIVVQSYEKDWEITMPLLFESFSMVVNDVRKVYGGPERLEISLHESASPIVGANVDININGVNYVRTTDSNGCISMPINLNSGVYDAVVTYKGASKKARITVNQIDTEVSLNVYRMFKNNVYMEAMVENASDGEKIIFKVRSFLGEKEYESTIKNNKANYSLINSGFAKYFYVDAIYSGDVNHKSSSDSSDLKFDDDLIPIRIYSLVKYYGESKKLTFNVRDSQGNLVYNASLKVVIDNKSYITTTDLKGVALLDVDLKSGNYTAEVSYLNPDDENDGFYNTTTIIVKPTIVGNDIIVDYGNNKFSVSLTDSSGNPLSEGNVSFKMNSKSYTASISNGKATLSFRENVGSYIIESTNPVTGETCLNNITVRPYSTGLYLYLAHSITTADVLTVSAFLIPDLYEGYIVFNIGSESKTVNVNGSWNLCNFSGLSEGSYVVTATFHDVSGNYLSNSASRYLVVSKVVPVLSVVADDIGEGQNAIFEVTLNNDSTGEVGVSINGRTYRNNLTGGKTIVSVPDLPIGNYTYNVTYYGDPIYSSASLVGNISVYTVNVILKAADLIKYYGSTERLSAQLLDNSSNPLSGEKIIFKINDVENVITTDSLGFAYVDVALNEGYYIVDIIFNGNNGYNPIRTKVQLEIKSTIHADDLTKTFRDNTKYYAEFLDSQGKALKNTRVSFTINCTVHEISTDKKGVACLSIDLNSGSYVIESINPVTGETCSKRILVNPIETDLSLSGIKNIMAKDSLTVYANLNASSYQVNAGYVVFKINSNSIAVNLTNNRASYTISGLSGGSYVVTATYCDDLGNYLSSSDSKSFDVLKLNPEFSVVAQDIVSGQNAVFEIILNKDADGEVILAVNNKSYRSNLTGGKAIIRVSALSMGNYIYNVTYNGNSIYNSASACGNISVYSNVVLKAYDVVKYYSSNDRLSAQLLDSSGKPLSGQKIIFTINGHDYSRTTDNSGLVYMAVNLNSGKYAVDVRFEGNDKYDSVKTKVNVEVKPTVQADDLTKMFRNDTQYCAAFFDSNGKLLKNTMVKFNINGVYYNRSTNENGVARLNINLNPGNYILTAENPSTAEFYTNKVTVSSLIADDNDLTKYYRNESKYTLKILDNQGNSVGAGVGVKLNINGVFYERKTNSSGYINFNINLNPGDYIITAEYKNCKVSNRIKVLPILQAKDITMKYRDGTKFVVKLLNGKGSPFADQNVTFNVNGVFYNRLTDANGVARLNINLMAGEYIITSTYSNGAAISNKITINA